MVELGFISVDTRPLILVDRKRTKFNSGDGVSFSIIIHTLSRSVYYFSTSSIHSPVPPIGNYSLSLLHTSNLHHLLFILHLCTISIIYSSSFIFAQSLSSNLHHSSLHNLYHLLFILHLCTITIIYSSSFIFAQSLSSTLHLSSSLHNLHHLLFILHLCTEKSRKFAWLLI